MNTFKKHKLVIKNIIFTIIPATIFPLIDNLPIFDNSSKVVFIIIAIIFIIYQVIHLSLKEENDNKKLRDDLNNYEKYQTAQKILNNVIEVEKLKRNLLKTENLPDYKKQVLLYNPHEFVEQICSNVKSLISNLTEITLSSLSVSFIYQYPGCNSNWQWITRKNSSINKDLNDFIVNDNFHSYFNYIITNNLSSHFENDKENLIKEGHYWISENDKRFSSLGSIASYKMTFMKNETMLCIGYLVISTYGMTFVEKNNPEKISNFNNLLTNNIIPSYRHLIEAELGFMYVRHDIIEKSKTQ